MTMKQPQTILELNGEDLHLQQSPKASLALIRSEEEHVFQYKNPQHSATKKKLIFPSCGYLYLLRG